LGGGAEAIERGYSGKWRRGGLMEKIFTAVFEKAGDWHIAYAEELPGANTQGRTLEEARENLREAIELV
jgi:hypothetical protein